MAQNMTPQEVRSQTFRSGLSVFGKVLLAGVLCVIMYLSCGLLAGIGQDQIGYRYYTEPVTDASMTDTMFDTTFTRYDEYLLSEDGKSYVLDKSYAYNYDTHAYEYSAELTEAAKAERPVFDEKTMTESKTDEAGLRLTQTQALYGENAPLEVGLEIVAQLLMLTILIAILYTPLWRLGDGDRNKVDFGRMQADKLRGLKIGLIGSAPSGLVALGLVVSKLTGLMPNYIFAYRLLSMIFAPINNALTSGVAWTSQVTWWMLPVAVLCWAVVPLTTALAYWFGYNRVSLGERLVYKKK